MLAKFLFLTILIEISIAYPQVSIRYFDGENGKVLEGREPRLENQEKLREPRIDTNCEGILTPSNPDCCFMIDPNHERTKPFGQPLEKSPFKINLVAAGKQPLNKFEKAKYKNSDVFTNLWKLTPLKEIPINGEQIEGGPIKLQVCFYYLSYCKASIEILLLRIALFINNSQNNLVKSLSSRSISILSSLVTP